MIDVLTVDAISTIALLASIEAMYPAMRMLRDIPGLLPGCPWLPA